MESGIHNWPEAFAFVGAVVASCAMFCFIAWCMLQDGKAPK